MRAYRFLICLLPALLAGLGSPARAQVVPNSDYELRLPHTSGPMGGVVSVAATLDSRHVPPSAFLFSICHNPVDLTVLDAVAGDGVIAANGGQPPDHLGIKITDDQVTILADFFDANTLPLGVHEVLTVDYLLHGPTGTTVPLELCGVAWVLVEPEVFAPVRVSGSVTNVGSPLPLFTFSLSSVSVEFPAGIGEASFEVSATICETPASPGQPLDTFGFSLGVRHDQEFLAITEVSAAPVLESLNAGGGPDFFSAVLMPDGFTLGVIYSLAGTETVHFEPPQEVARLSYETNVKTMQSVSEPVTTTLDWTNTLGTPPIDNTVVVSPAGAILPTQQLNGGVTLVPGGAEFTRGDCTGNGNYDIGDPIGLLTVLFSGIGSLGCEDACDADDSGEVSVADALHMLGNIFQNGPPPPGPYPICGLDPSDDTLDCDHYACP